MKVRAACLAAWIVSACGSSGSAVDAAVAPDPPAPAPAPPAQPPAPPTVAPPPPVVPPPVAPPEVSPSCRTDGCLRAVVAIGEYTRESIEPFLEPGVRIANGYEVWRIVYFTDGREARTSVTFPFPRDTACGAAPCAPPSFRGYDVGVVTPGTVGLADECSVGNGVAGTGLAGFFGAYGMVGAAVDYPGLGTDGLHPYLVRTVEARAALDAIRAVLALARRESLPVSERAVVAGLSQGGHAAISAAAEHGTYAPEIAVRAFAAAAPANVYLEQWATGVSVAGAHIALHAMLVHAWSVHYAHAGSPLFDAALAADLTGWMESRCSFESPGAVSLQSSIPHDPARVFDPAFLAAYRAASLDAYPAIARGFADNRLAPYRQTAPLLVYQGTADDVVLPWMTRALVADLRSGGVEVDFREVEGGTHTDVAFSFVASSQRRADEARAWLRAQLDR